MIDSVDDRRPGHSSTQGSGKAIEGGTGSIQGINGGGKIGSKKTKFRYGNYTRYYGYRTPTNMETDPRLEHMEPEWFAGKDCLDIGCNAGNFTIAVGTIRCTHTHTLPGNRTLLSALPQPCLQQRGTHHTNTHFPTPSPAATYSYEPGAADRYAPESIVGMDIDSKLIRQALKHLQVCECAVYVCVARAFAC